MTCRLFVGVVALSCVAALEGQQGPVNQNIDFRNFTYSFPTEKFLLVPSRLTWMSMNLSSTVTLVNGRFDFNKDDPYAGPSLVLDSVLYGYLTSPKQLDAVVVLGYHTGGTAFWYYVYAFSLYSGSPKLVGWFQAGSRAYFGLYRLVVRNGDLVVDLLDPDRRMGDCCSEGFVRTIYNFGNGSFVQNGPQEFGTVEVPSQK